MKLSAMGVRKLAPKEKPFLVHDGGGLYLRVLPGGTKSWTYMYTVNGRKRWYGMGTWPEVSLAEAREKLLQAKKQVKAGKDPLQEEEEARRRVEEARRKEQENPTVKEIIEEFLRNYASKLSEKTQKEYRRNLEKDVLPVLGNRKARDVTRRDISALLRSIKNRGADNQALQVFKIVRKMFNFAVHEERLEVSPCTNLDPPSPAVAKDRYLKPKEIKKFWEALPKSPMSQDLQRALKLILLTAQRPGEVLGTHSREFDGDWWIIPKERMKKKKREQRLYLTGLTKELFGTTEGLIFPSPIGKNKGIVPIKVNALATALRRAFATIGEDGELILKEVDPFTPHDLRRTAATHMAQLGFTDEVIGEVLHHTRPGVTAIYNRFQYDTPKKDALTLWRWFLLKFLEGWEEEPLLEWLRTEKAEDFPELGAFCTIDGTGMAAEQVNVITFPERQDRSHQRRR